MSKMQLSAFLIIATGICMLVSFGYGKTANRKLRKGAVSLVEAFMQRTLPGRKEASAITTMHFIIVWNNKEYPEKFVWAGNDRASNCSFAKVHKIPLKANQHLYSGLDYYRENGSPDKIQQGDTLDIIPLGPGNVDLPQSMQSFPKNTLIYYKNNEKNFFGFHVDSITRKPDITMP